MNKEEILIYVYESRIDEYLSFYKIKSDSVKRTFSFQSVILLTSI